MSDASCWCYCTDLHKVCHAAFHLDVRSCITGRTTSLDTRARSVGCCQHPLPILLCWCRPFTTSSSNTAHYQSWILQQSPAVVSAITAANPCQSSKSLMKAGDRSERGRTVAGEAAGGVTSLLAGEVVGVAGGQRRAQARGLMQGGVNGARSGLEGQKSIANLLWPKQTWTLR